MPYEPVESKPRSAEEFFRNPPIKVEERLQGFRNRINRKCGHGDYMDFAEIYADYICDYEKAYDYQNK